MTKLVTLTWDEEKAYFFSGSQYVRWDIASDRAEGGYPQPISSGWKGVFPDGFDAAAVWNNGRAYFFKGSEYTAYDVATDAALEGYPRSIAESWPGVFPDGIDAVVVWPNGKAYFFRGDQYLSYDMATDTVDEGYPRPIRDGWAQPFDDGIDTAAVWPDGKAYLFRGDDYVRFDIELDAADEDYPRPIDAGWPGVRSGGAPRPTPQPTPVTPGAHGCHASVRDVFIAFSVPFEARVRWMYLDIIGKVTTGIGNLIDTEADACKLPWKRDGVAATEAEIRAEWQLVKGKTELAKKHYDEAGRVTRLRLDDADIDELVMARFDANTQVLRSAYADWDSWPADAQLGCHSILWAGAYFPSDAKWPNFNKAARARDWATAADQSHLKVEGNPGVIHRNEANRELFLNAAKVDAEGLDITALLYRR